MNRIVSISMAILENGFEHKWTKRAIATTAVTKKKSRQNSVIYRPLFTLIGSKSKSPSMDHIMELWTFVPMHHWKIVKERVTHKYKYIMQCFVVALFIGHFPLCHRLLKSIPNYPLRNPSESKIASSGDRRHEKQCKENQSKWKAKRSLAEREQPSEKKMKWNGRERERKIEKFGKFEWRKWQRTGSQNLLYNMKSYECNNFV